MSAVDGDEITTASGFIEPTHRSRRRVLLVPLTVVCALALYLGFSLLRPETFPRPTFLPKPAARSPLQDRECGGGGNWHSDDWVARDGFWRSVEWSTLTICI